MKKLIVAEKTDQKAGKYFNAGKDTADALVLALGPVHKVAMAINTIDNIATADFAAGVLFGLTGDDQTAEFEKCFQGTDQFYNLAQALLADVQAKDLDKIQIDGQAFFEELLKNTATCNVPSEDVTEITNWLSIFEDPKKAKAVIAKNYILHKRGIEKDEDAIKSDLTAEHYFQGGVDSADLMTLLLGPVQ